MSAVPSRSTMARERSWFHGFTMREVDKTSRTAAAAPEAEEGGEVDVLANMVSTGAVLSGIDPEKERDPPEGPLVVVFPAVKAIKAVGWSYYHPPPNFQELFASIQKPEVLLSRHIKALNFDRRAPGLGYDMFPRRANGSHYIKSAKSVEDQSYADRVGELTISNDAAFRALSKTTKPGEKAPRLAHLRGFWIGLDNMAQYWTSPDDPKAEEYFTRDGVTKYKGRRIANGKEMPDAYRADTLRGLVESVVSAFRCRVTTPHVTPPRLTPVLVVGNLEQPVRLTGLVSRLPEDREKATSRILEGPIMGLLERNDIDFFKEGKEKISDRKCVHDLLREAAALLLTAQERRREGKTPVKAGEGKWYTTAPRWGGGPGGKIPCLQKREDELADVQSRLDTAENPDDALKKEASDAKRNLKKAQKTVDKYFSMACNAPVWDNKTDYMAIGKAPESDYDEIYLVSCLFHHVCIIKLTIHDAYIDYLTTGVMPSPVPFDDSWSTPIFERTQWFDLFVPRERTYAFSVIWAAMDYMTRDTGAAKTGDTNAGEAATTQAGAESTSEARSTQAGEESVRKDEAAQTGAENTGTEQTDGNVATISGTASSGSTAAVQATEAKAGDTAVLPIGADNSEKIMTHPTSDPSSDVTTTAQTTEANTGEARALQTVTESLDEDTPLTTDATTTEGNTTAQTGAESSGGAMDTQP